MQCTVYFLLTSFLFPLLSMSLFSSYAKQNSDMLYFVFRVLVGVLFLQHGLQKIGLLDGQLSVQGLFGFIGLCELAGGLALVVGMWTRLVAVLGTVLLLGAYITAHMGNGLLPIVNRGELALLYIASFLVLFAHGAGTMSIEKSFTKKEVF